jgi:hypothetical protein
MPRWLGWRVSARSNMDRKPLRGNFSPKRRAVVAKMQQMDFGAICKK